MTRRIPLFPLGVVLLPRMPLPLHIFEERYRLMISRCIEREEPFGIVLNTGNTLQSTGCLAQIDNVINEYPDGRSDILVVGTERFELIQVHEDKAYLEGDVQLFHDQSEDFTGYTTELAQDAITTLQSFARVVGYDVDEELLNRLSLEELSFMLATTDVFSVEERQRLLEFRSTAQRLELAKNSLKESIQKRKMSQAIRKIIGEDSDISHLFN